MPILETWGDDRCPVGHYLFITDCRECHFKMIEKKKAEINKLIEKIPTLPDDKYKKGELLFNE